MTADSIPEKRRRRLWVYAARALFGATMLLALLVVGVLASLEWLAQTALDRFLADHELDDVYACVRRVSAGRVSLGPVRVGRGDDALSAELVDVDFLPWELAEGRIREVRIHGLKVVLVETEGQWRVPALAALGPVTGQAGGSDGGKVPACDRVAVRSSHVQVWIGDETVDVPFTADCDTGDLRNVSFRAGLQPGGDDLGATGSLDTTTGDGGLYVTFESEAVQQWLPVVRLMVDGLPSSFPEFSADVACEATARLTAWRPSTVSASVKSRNVFVTSALGPVHARDARLLIRQGENKLFEEELRLEALDVAGHRVNGISIANVGPYERSSLRLAVDSVDAFPGCGPLHLDGTVALDPDGAISATGGVAINPSGFAEIAPGVRLDAAERTVDVSLTSSVKRGAMHYGVTLTVPEGEVGVQFGEAGKATSSIGGVVNVAGDAETASVDVNATVEATELAHGGVTGSLRTGRFELSVPALPVSSGVGTAGELLAAVMASGRVTLVDASGGTEDVQVAGLTLNLPFLWSGESGFAELAGAEQARLSVSEVRSKWGEARDVETACALSGTRFSTDGTFRLVAPSTNGTVDGWADWGDGLRAGAEIGVAPFELNTTDQWYRRLAGMTDLSVAGRVSANANVALSHGEATASGVVTATGVDVAKGQEFEVKGIEATVNVADFAALRTKAHQTLRFRGAMVGGMPIDGGAVTYQIESPESIFIERCVLAWCGGRLRTHALRLNPAKPVLDMLLIADNIDVGRVVSLLRGGEAEATGKLYGQLPLYIRPGRVKYRDGFLYSIPGETGRLKVRQAGFLTAAVPKEHADHAQLRLAEEALRNLEYSLFKMDFAGDGMADTRLRLRIVGEPAAGSGRPVDLNINVNGPLAECLNAGLRLSGF